MADLSPDMSIPPFGGSGAEARVRSERARAEAALQESEARWRTLAEVDPNGILVMNDQSVILAANPAVERILGYSAEELVGQPLHVLIPERLREAHRAGVRRYLATGRRSVSWSGVELPALSRQGREIPVEIAFGEYLQDGQHVFAGFIHDISERKREEARRAAEHGVTRVLASVSAPEDVPLRMLAAVCESLGWDLGGFWRPDPEGRHLRCAAVWHRPDGGMASFAEASRATTFGLGEGLPGRVWKDARATWIPDILRDHGFPRARAAAEVGLHAAFAFPILIGEEVAGVMEFFARFVEEPDPALLGSMEAIGSDVGQYIRRRRAERERDQALAQALEARRLAEEHAAQLEEVQAELELANHGLKRVNEELSVRTHEAEWARALAEEANQSKSAFLANMSHELRTPLNAITGYTDLLALGIGGPLTDAQTSHLERIKSSTHHLLRLINEILDLAKIESGQMMIQRERVSVPDVVRDALDLIGPQAAGEGIELRNELVESGECTCWGDEDRVRQILVNLLSNAVKFTERGGQVSVACRTPAEPDPDAQLSGAGPWIVIEVVDTGVGIPPEKRKEVFSAFVQVDPSHTREHGGTGLGLTISLRMARLMGGDLTVRSELGRGSCFSLWLAAGPGSTQEEANRRPWPRLPHRVPRLAEVGQTMVRCANEIVEELGERLRADPAIPGARDLNRAQLHDHTATILVDLGLALVALDEGAGELALMRDGTDIQRVISQLHGAQRARLAWSEEALRREFAILREITDRTLRRSVPVKAGETVEEGMGIVVRLLEQAERVSLRGWSRAVRDTPDKEAP